MNLILEIIKEAFSNICYFIKRNLVVFANILNTVIPYLMLIIGQLVALERNRFYIGSEVIIPLIFAIIIYIIRTAANKLGKGITIPVPKKRFTEVDEDGEVSVEQNRLSEMLLYMADLEDWLSKKGML